MRYRRCSSIAVMTAVAFVSLSGTVTAFARDDAAAPDVSVQLEAIDAAPARINPALPANRHARSRRMGEAKPEPATFVDEDTPWVLPPGAPPEVLDAAGVLQCVPYARFMSGIGLHGDAWTWWDQAAGLYARGNHPEPGAVLSFPGIERMPLGHLSVVTQVLSERKILVDHANWPNATEQHGAISRDVQVIDISSANDWTEVRVQFGEGGPMGSVYPVNGFIYGWTETGVQIARPRFSLDYALWSPGAASWRMFNSIAYLWALPPAERKKAYAAAAAVPDRTARIRVATERTVPAAGPVEPPFLSGALVQILGVNPSDAGLMFPATSGERLVMQ